MAYQKGKEMKQATNKSQSIETVEEVMKYPMLEIAERHISKKTAEHFGIRTALSETDGKTPVAHYFPYYCEGKLTGFKKRDLTAPKYSDSHFSVVGFQSTKCDLFGMQSSNKTGGKKIWITEGEYDAAILWQVLKEKYPTGNPSVLSISSGTANAVRNIGQKQNQAYIGKFEDTIICFDADKATTDERLKDKIIKGKDALGMVYGLMPHIKYVDLPEDLDVCDMVVNGNAEQLFWLAMKPKGYVPDGFVKYDTFKEKAKELPVLGKPWPWPTMTKLSLGRRLGEGHYFGAGVKIGKSEFVNQLTEHIISVEKRKVAIFKFEEEPEITCKKIAGKMYHKDFTNPEKVLFIQDDGSVKDIYGNEIVDNTGMFTQTLLSEAVDSVGDNIIYYNNYGACSWDIVKGAIRHAVLVEGVEDVVIDPISRMIQGLTASEANTALEKFSDEISKMAKDLGFTYYCFCHLKSPESGVPHERGGKVLSHQFTGSRAMMRSTYYMWGIERNKDPDLAPKERSTSNIVLLEDRKYGRSGYFKVFYNTKTGDYLEPPEGFLDSGIETLEEWDSINKNGATF